MTKQDLVRVVQLAEMACQEYAFQRLKLGRAVIVAKTADGRTRLGWDQSDVDAIEAVAAYAPSSPSRERVEVLEEALRHVRERLLDDAPSGWRVEIEQISAALGEK